MTHILKTKLCPPRLPALVVRDRLLEEMRSARSVKLTAIVAGAGYGKTALAAEFLATEMPASVWYELDEADRDLSVFITYLVTGLREVAGDIGDKTLTSLDSADGAQMSNRVALTTLVSELEASIEEDLFIVLDDFHQVDDSPAIIEALEFLLDRVPHNVHLIILSRSKLGLDLSYYRAHREILEITENSLCFGPDEISDLFSNIFGLPMKDSNIETLSRLTEGWVSGLVLFYHALRSRGEAQIGAAIKGLTVPTSVVSEYLSRIVYTSQSEEVRDFVMRSSILSRMNPDFCDELLGVGHSARILAYLVDEGLFTTPLDDRGEWYRFHHIMRGFLQEMLSENCAVEEIRGLHAKAASLWMELGEPEQALYHYLEGADYDGAASVLEEAAHDFMKASRISFLYNELRRIPTETLDAHPWLVFDLAATADMLGEYEEALEAYNRAARLFEERGNTDAEAQSLFNAVRILGTSGRPDEIREIMTRIVDIVPRDTPEWYEVSSFLAMAFSVRGFADFSEQFLEEAISHADEVSDETTRARILFWCGHAKFHRGDFISSCEIFSDTRDLCERIEYNFVLPQTHALLSSTMATLGRLEEAEEIADRGLSLSEDLGLKPGAFLNRSVRALIRAVQGEHQAALEDESIASESAAEYEAGIETLFTEFYSGEVHMLCGESTEAVKHFEKAKRMARDNQYPDIERLARLGIIWETLDELDVLETREEVKEAIESLEESGSKLTLIYHKLLLAWLEKSAGNDAAASDTFETAIGMCERSGIVGWWMQHEIHSLPLVAELFSRGRYLDYLNRIFELAGADALPYLSELENSEDRDVSERASRLIKSIGRELAGPLRVKVLGPFEVSKGEEKIPKDSWKSKKALSVLKYLAAHHDRGLVPRDVLMELLWPGSSPDSAAKNLNMALTSLRKTLEPGASRGESSYLVTSGDSLQLDLGEGGWIDIDILEERLEEARVAEEKGQSEHYLESLLEAEELYSGDFLSEDLYEDWCQPIRERLRQDYLDLLGDIASEYLGRGNHERALDFVDRATERDPTNEEFYRLEMKIHSQMGNRAGIERAFQRCRRSLEERFEVSPSPETVDLYHELRGD